MKITGTAIPGVLLVEPQVYSDDRGFFLETYHHRKFTEQGLPAVFVQDNHSKSSYGILRGLHAQRRQPQGKLIRAVEGEIWDVAVDIRRSSPTFRQWVGVALSADSFRQLYVPPGFAHGFVVLSKTAQVVYKCTDYYLADDELGLRWDDSELAIDWPVKEPLLSAKDAAAPTLAEAWERLPE